MAFCRTANNFRFFAWVYREIGLLPQEGDIAEFIVYSYTTPGHQSVYALRDYLERNGSFIYDRTVWVDSFPDFESPLLKRIFSARLSSPATIYLTDPIGKNAGTDPSNGSLVFEYELAISDAGDEPYLAVLPTPMEGEYKLSVVGYETGPYTLIVSALDENGMETTPIQVSGFTEPGQVTEFSVTYEYSASGETNISLTKIVDIDIKPGSLPNCFNNDGNGVIPVAILGGVDFDASQVDPMTVGLDGLGVRVVGKGNTQAHIEDINLDGYSDLVLQLEDVDGTFIEGDSVATLTGETIDGTSIQGLDSICIVP